MWQGYNGYNGITSKKKLINLWICSAPECPEWSLASCLWQRQPSARGIAKRSPEPGGCRKNSPSTRWPTVPSTLWCPLNRQRFSSQESCSYNDTVSIPGIHSLNSSPNTWNSWDHFGYMGSLAAWSQQSTLNPQPWKSITNLKFWGLFLVFFPIKF